jgi:hypothetical protein
VYRCSRCNTPLERGWFRFKASAAAAAALRDGDEPVIEVEWRDGEWLDNGLKVWGERLGEVILFDPDDPKQVEAVQRKEAERRARHEAALRKMWQERGWIED